MKIKKRILISSACMILLALLSLLVVGGIVIHSFSKNEYNIDRLRIDPGLFPVEESLRNIDEKRLDFSELELKLAEYKYELIMMNENEVIYQSENFLPIDYDRFIKGFIWEENTQAFTIGTYTILGKKLEDITVIAYKATHKMTPPIRFNDVLRRFLFMGAVTICVVVIAGQIFTNYLAKRFLDPINELSKGAKRIEVGNLTEPVIYAGEDEFTEVCDAFNQMQKHLKEGQDKTLSYEKARIDLIAGISHDLRTPLTSIKGYIKGLWDGVAKTPEKQEQYLSIAYQKACDMETLLQQLFYFSGMETGNLPILLEKKDLRDYVEQFRGDYEKEFQQKGGQLEVINTVNAMERLPVMIDTIQMNRILLNLAENALKYAGAEKTVMTIKLYKEENSVYLSFSDNGKGVMDEQLPHLFERFWRGDGARSRKNGQGSGLGLYIVKYIVESHGGKVTAENENGLSINIMLPYAINKDKGPGKGK